MSLFKNLPTLSECTVLTVYETIERFPDFEDALDEDWEDDDPQVLIVEGDFVIDGDWQNLLNEADASYLLIDGNVELKNSSHFNSILWVTGDLSTDALHWTPYELTVLGAITARHYATLIADDHAITRKSPHAIIITPYFFSSFFKVDQIKFNPDCLIFILADWTYSHNLYLQLPNPVFPWHDGRFVLRDEVQQRVESSDYDGTVWNEWNIRPVLAANQSILRDGISIDNLRLAMNSCHDADDAKRLGKQRLAWLHYQRAATQCPDYYPAYYQMGSLMYDENAFDQALPYLERAALLYPKSQSALANDAAIYAGLAALRSSQFARALHICNAALQHNDHAYLYRTRAEAYLLLGEIELARQDLQTALAKSPEYPTANWLMGLVLFQDGAHQEAEQYRQQAIEEAQYFDVSYVKHQDTSFLVEATVHLDWEQGCLENEITVKDAAWWQAQVMADAPHIVRMPMEMRTAELLEKLIDQLPQFASTYVPEFPDSAFTVALAKRVVALNASFLTYIPRALIDKEICLSSTSTTGCFPINDIPEEIIDKELCLHALRSQASLCNIPEQWRDLEVCKEAIKFHAHDIAHVPATLICDELWLLALAHGSAYFIENKLPARFKTKQNFEAALALNKALLNELPGNYFDQNLYLYAQNLYGMDDDWQEIVSAHQAVNCLTVYTDFAEKCWLAFWDEASMLHKISQSGGYRLAPYDIPAGSFNQRIADACFKAQPIHINSIPAQFVTAKMCRRFIEAYPDQLGDIPLVKRDRDICVIALAEDMKQAELVPAEQHAAVFDYFLSGQQENYDPNMLRTERARGYLMLTPPDVDAAILDLKQVLNSVSGDTGAPTTECAANAKLAPHAVPAYLLGYCYHLRGKIEQATQWCEYASQIGIFDSAIQSFSEFSPKHDKPIADFNRVEFSRHMIESEQYSRNEYTYREAWVSIMAAEENLRSCGNQNAVLWAQLLDKKRWLSYELAMWDENTAICQQAIERLERVALWEYISGDDAIRSTLRAAYHRLGALVLDQEGSDVEALKQGLALVDKALGLRGATEDKSVLEPFYDAQLRLLQQLSTHNEHFAARFKQALKQLKSMRWRSFIYSDEAQACLLNS